MPLLFFNANFGIHYFYANIVILSPLTYSVAGPYRHSINHLYDLYVLRVTMRKIGLAIT